MLFRLHARLASLILPAVSRNGGVSFPGFDCKYRPRAIFSRRIAKSDLEKEYVECAGFEMRKKYDEEKESEREAC